MSFASLFEQVVAFDDEVYRNIVKLSDDFSDVSDNESSDEAINLLLTYVSRNTDTDKQKKYYTTAVAFPLDRPFFSVSRYSDGIFPVWYGSTESETTLYETAYHMLQDEMAVGVAQSPSVITRYRDIYSVQCEAILINLLDKQINHPELVSDDYSYCQRIGKMIHQQGHPGLITPSARCDRANVNIFNPSVLSSARLKYQCCYQLSIDKREVKVIYQQRKKSKVIRFDN
ncbi:MAG: RES family NAD+ phosphorylase [Coxiellaceae bacterium]|nr:RES family NAD+ phosphorylase [Coxiellaceae bacterium]